MNVKVAIVHDWLVIPGGGEKVLAEIIKIFPDANLYSIVDFLKDEDRKIIQNKKVNTSFIQKFPKAKTKYRNYLPFMMLAIEQFDMSAYDIIISCSHAVAKGVITGPNQLHICYCHSPIRYAWDMQHQYLKESNLDKGFRSFIARWILHKVRIWDYRTSFGVDFFIANSNYIAKRIKKVYGRTADVIHPNVAVNDFTLLEAKDDFFLTASRMVPYKRIDLIVESFRGMPDKKLVVIGDGPQFESIRKIAPENVELMGYQPFPVLKDFMSRAKAFIFAAEEDFGIIPVEAQACGTPVIAFGRGGALETVIPYGLDKPTGVFFDTQDTSSIIESIQRFESIRSDITPKNCRENALRFSEERFRKQLQEYILGKWDDFSK